VCSTFYDKKIDYNNETNTHTNVHIQYSRHTSFTPHQIHHTAYNQVSSWSITCILDMESNPHFQKTAENRRENNHIVY